MYSLRQQIQRNCQLNMENLIRNHETRNQEYPRTSQRLVKFILLLVICGAYNNMSDVNQRYTQKITSAPGEYRALRQLQ